MEHNQHLNEIFYLITGSYADGSIKLENFEEIKNFLSSLENNEKINPLRAPYYPIPDADARMSIGKFVLSYLEHEKFNKKFSIEKFLLGNLTVNQQDVILWLVEVQGNFELVHYADPKNINLIDCQNQKIIPLCNDDFDTYKNNFDNGLGLNSDQVFATLSGKKNKNTRKITIPYIGNFDNTNYQNSDYINLIPAVGEDSKHPNYDQFTFVMYFGSKIGAAHQKAVTQTYYDTFQLCPPAPAGSNC